MICYDAEQTNVQNENEFKMPATMGEVLQNVTLTIFILKMV